MTYRVEKQQGANKWAVAYHPNEAAAVEEAMNACTSRESDWVVFNEKSFEVGRAVFHNGQAEWRPVPR